MNVKWENKIDSIDIFAMVACVMIAVVSIVTTIHGETHTCEYCKKRIVNCEEEYVISDGQLYYHTSCYLKKVREEFK